MRRVSLASSWVLGLAVAGFSGMAGAQDAAPQTALATLTPQVEAIFNQRCTACHGPVGVRRYDEAKGGFDYVLDLERLAGSRKLINPGDPDNSKLFKLVQADEMPKGAKVYAEDPVPEAEKAIIRVANVFEATSQLSQTTLRSVLGQHELDDMLAEREKLNTDIQALLDTRTDNWGIKVANVEIKHVDIDESMIRAIAQQAEAERARRAKIINAEGEMQAASMLAEAAKTLSQQEQALQLRYLQTLKEIANEKTNTIIFPVPMDLLAPAKNSAKASAEKNDS